MTACVYAGGGGGGVVVACQIGWWCTIGTPTPILENWPKIFEDEKKSVGVPPPPPPKKILRTPPYDRLYKK